MKTAQAVRTGSDEAPDLTDDAFTVAPPHHSVGAWFRNAVDRFAGADPGLTQLRNATQATLGIALAVGLVYVFVKATGALQIPTAGLPAAAAQQAQFANHALLIVAMLLGGITALMAGLAVNDTTVRGQLISSVLLPLPMLATMTLGLAVGGYRLASLVFLVVVLTAAVYVRRFGPRGFAAGLVAFNGGFLGFFLHAELGLSDLGWLAADIGIGVLASMIVRFALLRPNARHTLARMRRSWDARARRLITLAVETLDAPSARHRDRTSKNALSRDALAEQVRRQVVRFNESTLMVDAQLVQALPDRAAYDAQQLFDAELALTNAVRFATALAALPVEEATRLRARTALTAMLNEDWDAAGRAAAALRTERWDSSRSTVLSFRLGSSVQAYVTARRALAEAVRAREADEAAGTYQPAVELLNGFLPGSVPVSTAASTTPGRGFFDRTALPPYLRASIQIAVASTIAIALGDLVSGFRLYWAVLATFLAFMATTNSGEQVRKALFRVAGTAVGIVVGDLLVHLTGGVIWASLLIVLAVLFVGIYTIRVNYTFMVIGITVTLSQLYYQLGEFSWSLLLLRLAETAIGVGAVMLTVLVIVPLRPQRVLSTGTLLWFRSLSALVAACLSRMTGGEAESLRGKVRDADAAWAAFEATSTPLQRSSFGRNGEQLAEIRSLSVAARNYTRSLANNVESARIPDSPALQHAADQLGRSCAAIEARIEKGRGGTYVRSGALLEAARQQLGSCGPRLDLAIRDLVMLDGTLARFATALDMDVRDYDTTDLTDSEHAPETAST